MTKSKNLFPGYVHREAQEQEIRRLVIAVQQDQRSQAVLISGPGGVGKTFLVRHLAESMSSDQVIWLEPIDVDDSEFWLLPNLERKIAEELSAKGPYFQEYLDKVSQLPKFEQERFDHETVLAHLRESEKDFHKCFEWFIRESGLTSVITLDTIEAIRGTDMLLNLTQWVKKLPGVLFILAGRPVPPKNHDDPIIKELTDPYQPLPLTQIDLPGFTWAETIAYLTNSGVAPALSQPEQEKLTWLTQGHPLWLALVIEYLSKEGIPQEVKENTIEQLHKWLPYQAKPMPFGKRLQDVFVRRLVVLYRETDFWHEAIKRLAVVRQRVDQSMWEQLMADRALPQSIKGWDEAWQRLLQLPWIRSRANRNYVTLHDVLAEELARRIIPLHDKEETWRRQQWLKASQIYRDLIEKREQILKNQQEILTEALRPDLSSERQGELVKRVALHDTQKRDLDQLKAAQFYYQMLCDFEAGCQEFIKLFDQASREHEFRFRELLWLEMQHFLPGEGLNMLDDVIRPMVERFQAWLSDHPDLNYEIGRRGVHLLIQSERSKEADQRLVALLDKFKDNPEREFRLSILRGNARMRISGRVRGAEKDFKQALKCTQYFEVAETQKLREGEAYKELGFYYRQTGNWQKAANAYLEALRITPLSDQEERASIQANWAYIQGLRGHFQEALDLVEGALTVRQRRNLRRRVGMALSIKGEILRYSHNFPAAWETYREAEEIFRELGDWPWLGTIFQEQAMCLFQSSQARISLANKGLEQMVQEARSLARQALDVCRDHNIRAFPSALNRAARIFGYDDPKQGLELIEDGIKQAKEVADGWFLFANLIEFVELNYKLNDPEHRTRIEQYRPEIEQVKKDYDFPDLSGRWELLQGHLKVNDALARANQKQQLALLNQAIEHYKQGFPLLAKGFVGSHGAHAIPAEFKRLTQIFGKLPPATQKEWCQALQEAWSDPKYGYIDAPKESISLLARLTEVYEELQVVAP